MNFFQGKKQDVSENIAAVAGAKLLSKFQADWCELHASSVDSSLKAKELSQLLEKFAADLKRTEEGVNRFCVQLQILPDLFQQVDEVAATLEKIEQSVSKVSCALDFFEKVCNERDLYSRRQAVLREVNELRMSKRQELEKVKGDLALKHAQQLAEIQAQQENIARERQKLLLDAISSGND